MLVYDQNDKILGNIVKAFEKRLKHKADIEIALDNTLGEFTGKIEGNKISAGSYPQLCDALGRFLRNKNAQGTFTSAKKICGMYFATHFKNYLDAAPLDEVFEYIDDLAFWGMNQFSLWFDMHHYENMEEGKECTQRLKAMLDHANKMGIKTNMMMLANEAFKNSPETLRADWTCGHDGYINELNSHYHVEICPSKKGGIEKIIEYRREMLEAFKDVKIDSISIGPYDQGGCSCKKCAPWGGNGYIKTVEAIEGVIREYFPNTELVLSLWQFGTFTGTDIEYIKLKEAFESGRLKNIKYLVSEPQYAEYPFKEGMPRPIIGFPEISMFGAAPWGGYGANPLPKLYQSLWERDGKKLDGGFPYSEGLYEDINKVIMLRFYRDNQSAKETVREYLSYEFGLKGEALEKALEAVLDMEETLEREYNLPYKRQKDGTEILDDPKTITHRYVIKNPEKAEKIEKLISEVDASLPEEIRNSKRWQLIYLRAMIDGELSRNDFYRNDTVMNYFKKIVEIAHLENAGVATKPDIFDENSGRLDFQQ